MKKTLATCRAWHLLSLLNVNRQDRAILSDIRSTSGTLKMASDRCVVQKGSTKNRHQNRPQSSDIKMKSICPRSNSHRAHSHTQRSYDAVNRSDRIVRTPHDRLIGQPLRDLERGRPSTSFPEGNLLPDPRRELRLLFFPILPGHNATGRSARDDA